MKECTLDRSPLGNSMLAAGAELRAYPKRALILEQWSPPEGLLLIEAGAVREFVVGPAGDEVTLNLYGPGDIMGEVAALDGLARPSTLLALTEVNVLSLRRDLLLSALHHDMVLRAGLTAILLDRLNQSYGLVAEMAALAVEVRLARRLLLLAEQFGRPADGGAVNVECPLREYELASFVPATRAHVSRALSDLRARGYLQGKWPQFTVPDIDRLRQLAVSAAGSVRLRATAGAAWLATAGMSLDLGVGNLTPLLTAVFA